MSVFIKAGLWTEKKLGYKGELNLSTLFPATAPTLQSVITNGNIVNFPAVPEEGWASGYVQIDRNYEGYNSHVIITPSQIEYFSNGGQAVSLLRGGLFQTRYYDDLNVLYEILIQGGRIRLGSQKTYGAYNVQAEILTDDIVGDKLDGQLDRFQQLTNASGKIPVINTSSPAPINATSSGFAGEIRTNSSYVYICKSDNLWIRIPITAW